MNNFDKSALKKYQEKLDMIKAGTSININESKSEKEARISKLKKDANLFVDYYFPHYCEYKSAPFQLELTNEVRNNETIKGIVRWGRGLGKTVWTCVFNPIFLWVNDEAHYLVILGNNKDKASISLSDIQAEFESNQRLINDFGIQKIQGTWEDGYFITKSGFVGKALGIGQSPRGLRYKNQRPDLIVADDIEDRELSRNPRRQDEIVDYIEKDLLPCMDGRKRRYLHVNNNPFEHSIQEILYQKHKETWTMFRVDAYDANYKPAWPSKYDDEYYMHLEYEIGILAAQAEYNNTPHVSGKIFNEDLMNYTSDYPPLNSFERIVGHWDVAYAGTDDSDFNAVRIWGLKNKKFYYIDSFVRRCKIYDAIEYMIQFQVELPFDVIVNWQFEAQFWNDAIEDAIESMQDATGVMLYLNKVDTPKSFKYDRLVRLLYYYQHKKALYPVGLQEDKDFIEGRRQLFGIEPGYRTKDDAPDADEQAIRALEAHKNGFYCRTGKLRKNLRR